jgi:hypothetical protein
MKFTLNEFVFDLCGLAENVVGWVCVIKKLNSLDGGLLVVGKRFVGISNDANGSNVIDDGDWVEVGQIDGWILDN